MVTNASSLPSLAEISVVPAAKAVTRPLSSTEATD